MSEFQLYAFLAIDRPLSGADRKALRAISSRAEITATSFTNHYEWGDLKGDPGNFMDRWFDVHVYLTNWGTRRLMLRLPTRLVERTTIAGIVADVEEARLRDSGDNLVLDITVDPEEPDDEWLDDGSGRIEELSPLRADILAGDLRALYLVWLLGVQAGTLPDDEPEPLPGLGPLTGPLAAFAEFFGLDPDLVDAAAEAKPARPGSSSEAARAAVEHLPAAEKTALLLRVLDCDPHIGAELRRLGRTEGRDRSTDALRTVGALRARAAALREARAHEAAERREAERRRKAEEAETARRARLTAVARQGEKAWHAVEEEIEQRKPKSYDRAAELLGDLKAIADERGTATEFAARLADIRQRHAAKGRFLERLTGLG
ncbi:hypothetical protein ASG52_18705 [Methylobacterium sp. Leaf456]|uniref:hypothetical protein n=1 Tax=Methylobacterium sp. Leaf456 TaxID=1736382 RepID=UPI0006F99CBF|nr:hypothetical protein [Methylobacterium sp. Leaf456]KQT60150.1 hypothetical protein ASG52_18705 [Methylobacterium sp. Leaf456]